MSGGARTKRARRILFLAGIFVLAFAGTANAYIGPGAGFVLAPVFLGLFVAFGIVLIVLALPFLAIFRALFAKKPPAGFYRRVVVIGLDGMDPKLAREYMDRGLLPNFAALAAEGTFSDLGTSVPSISPCAWSTFMTGCDASRHSIYDFITRDPCTYLPILSSARIEEPRRKLDVGPYRIPLGKPVLTPLRKSRTFWSVLSEKRVFSSILRVPITFPPEKFRGVLLSGMCAPDLRGGQGSFSYFTTAPAPEGGDAPAYGGEGGVTTHVVREGDLVRCTLSGPKNTLRRDGGVLTVPFTVRIDEAKRRVHLKVGRKKLTLPEKTYSPWIRVTFRPGLGIGVHGIVRFYVTSIAPEFGLYVTPIQIDPEKPALPISHPHSYAPYLARRNGPFATVGLAEDTWALNERVLDEDGFLAQAYDYFAERERQLDTALRTTRAGCVSIVFDTTDRVQHMFWRYRVPDHPANAGKDVARHAGTIEDLYRRMDALLGRIRRRLTPDDALFVVSDHGFTSFARGVNLNAWLRSEGYLVMKEGAEPGDWFGGVDWERTQAFALGLTGLFLNRQGRETKGVVPEGPEGRALRREIAEKLAALVDPKTGERPFRKLYHAEEIYDGPYRDEAPDLILGFREGYRVSWEGAVGRPDGEVFTDNVKSWSGDHCVDPAIVPGILFTNLKLDRADPKLEDLAPTVLFLLGVEAPAYMTGRRLVEEGPPAAPPPVEAAAPVGAGRAE